MEMSLRLLQILGKEDLNEAVDYGSDIDFIELNGSTLTMLTGEDNSSR